MLKAIFIFVAIIHGLIHIMGFSKAYHVGNIPQIAKDISKPAGLLWLITVILLIVAVLLFLMKKECWPYIAAIAIVISQVLIMSVWKDPKFGTIANIIVLLVSIAAWGSVHFASKFKKDVKSYLLKANSIQTDLLTETHSFITTTPSKVPALLQCDKQTESEKYENCI